MTEKSRREDFVNRSLDVFFSYQEQAPFHDRFVIMGQLGLHSSALDVVLNRESYVNMPASEGSLTELPFGDDSTKIAVMAVDPMREYELTVGFHPLQLHDDEVSQGLKKATMKACLQRNAGASVFNITSSLISDDDKVLTHYFRRPTLLLPYDGSQANASPVVMSHELTHAAQHLSKAVLRFEEPEFHEQDKLIAAYNRELDAYKVQETVFGPNCYQFLSDETFATGAMTTGYQRRYLQATGGHVCRESLDAIRRNRDVGQIVRRGYIPPHDTAASK